MLTRENYFPGQSSREQIALFIRRHWAAFAPWLLILAIVWVVGFSIMLFFWNLVNGDNEPLYHGILILASAVGSELLLYATLRAWMSYYLDVTIVTERRLIDIEQEGVFHRQIAEQSLARVQDISARQKGPIQHFLNFGSIYIETAGDTPNFELHNIPRPNEIARAIMNLHDRLIHGDTEMPLPKTAQIIPSQVPIAELEAPDLPAEESIKHPLENLRSYFPEPGQKPETVTQPSQEIHSPLSSPEGDLEEGKTVRLHSGK